MKKEHLYLEYIIKNKTCRAIAQEQGLEQKLVLKFIRCFGFKKTRAKINNSIRKKNTPSQIKFIRENINKLTYTEIAKQINVSHPTVMRWAKELGIARDANFAKEIKIMSLSKAGRNNQPIGTEVRWGKKNYKNYKKDKNGKWRAKKEVIWEEAYGEIPKTSLVTFIDGNKENITLENLQLVTKKEHYKNIKNHLTTSLSH